MALMVQEMAQLKSAASLFFYHLCTPEKPTSFTDTKWCKGVPSFEKFDKPVLKWIFHQKSHFHPTTRIPNSSLLPLLLCHKTVR